MDILKRIIQLREERGWTEYKLSLESGVPQSTISSWFRKNAQPSINSIEAICNACGITLSQFFSNNTDSVIELSEKQQGLLSEFSHLSNSQQDMLILFLKSFRHEQK